MEVFKKTVKAEWSAEDIKAKDLMQSMNGLRQKMIDYCRMIIKCEGTANMLPDGPDKDSELRKAEDCRKRILNLIAAYDSDFREFSNINRTKLYHYNFLSELDSHEALRFAWTQAMRWVHA